MESIKQSGNIRHFFQLLMVGLKNFLTSGLFIFIVIVVSAITLNHLGVVHYVLDYLGRDHITQVNETYLHHVKFQISESLLILSGLDAALEVVKSSSAGISFIVDVQVQVGNIFHTLHQYVEKAISVSSAAAASTIAIGLLMSIVNKSAVVILTITISAVASYFLLRDFLPRASIVAKKLSYAFSILSFMAFLGMPLALYATSLVSKSLTEPMAQQAHQHFKDVHQLFVSDKDDDLHEHVKSVVNKYQSSSHEVHQKSRSLSISTMRHFVAFLFSAFLFPLGFMLMIVLVTKMTFKSLFFEAD
jgi:hypothetical protein